MRLMGGLLVIATLLPGCAGNVPEPASPHPQNEAAAGDGGTADALAHAAATISPGELHEHIAFLASDELRGRDTPSPGLERAAEYIAEEFERIGLLPAGDSGTFIQRWPYEDTSLDPADVALRASGIQGSDALEFGSEFFLVPSPQDSVHAPLVFAGTAAPGRQALGPDAAGNIVAFYVPGAQPDQNWSAAISAAIQSGFSAGATGLMLVLDPAFTAELVSALAEQIASQTAPRPIVGVRYDAAAAIFRHAVLDLDVLIKGDNQLVPLGGSTVTVRGKPVRRAVHPPNVVAMLPGSDSVLKDTYVVFSAHIDHVGVGAPLEGDSIYNGADDDASGTATLLEVAQAFASLPARPARSLIFVGVSGEEKGLFGSAYFTQNPPVPAERMVANINLDMVGRNAPDTLVAIGMDYTSLGELVREVAQERMDLGLTVAPDPWPEENLFLRSDHFNFARAGIPAIFFTTGLHEQYHKPSDEVELIDTDKLARVARLVFYLGSEIATRAEAPFWTEAGRAIMRSFGGT